MWLAAPERRGVDLAGELRPGLALAGMDAVERLSLQVEALSAVALRRSRPAADPRWWSARLAGPAAEFDAGWARRAGPLLCRAHATRGLGRSGIDVTDLTHPPSRPLGPILGRAVSAVLPGPPGGSRWPFASGGAAVLVPGSVIPALSVLAGSGRGLPGPGPVLVCAGLVLLVVAGAGLRVRAVRAARAREQTRRVRAAVLGAAERELARRTVEIEHALARGTGAGSPVEGAAGPLRSADAGCGAGPIREGGPAGAY
ncbi:hypothetical protein [Pseudonocardia sp. HH130630-07]|uniref:hypothetical protein n=1 Tax=Pseudonocardia sp. HH130630-07 TaxID=1690815 RepID=UPI000814F8CC|nr:hypothetical protein [Pseudonocardia sp. HH130630-07]ANY06802.1 hypothetical protein AFB00_11455 [Pseudonocardia sp. HH130630-07]